MVLPATASEIPGVQPVAHPGGAMRKVPGAVDWTRGCRRGFHGPRDLGETALVVRGPPFEHRRAWADSATRAGMSNGGAAPDLAWPSQSTTVDDFRREPKMTVACERQIFRMARVPGRRRHRAPWEASVVLPCATSVA